MRLKYGELSVAEKAERERLQRRARSAWCALRAGDAEGAQRAFSDIDERIALVLSEVGTGARLAELTAFDAEAWPLAELVLAEAPSDVGFALSLGRGATSLERALSETRESHGLDLSRASMRAGFGRGHLLEVTLAVPGGNGSEIEQNAAENLVRALLGDRLFETWIGAVHVTAAPRGGPLRVLDARAPRSSLTLAELLPTVLAASLGARQGLPQLSYRSPLSRAPLSPMSEPSSRGPDAALREEWALLEMEPVSETGALDKSDLLLASTCTPELLRCYLEGAPCASQRFAREGERFVYVAYLDSERSMNARVERRTAIEVALSRSAGELGVVVGVGLGVTSTYVDLALFNLETGLPRLVSKLRELGLPRQSSIRFFDSELAGEWLDIWPDSNCE